MSRAGAGRALLAAVGLVLAVGAVVGGAVDVSAGEDRAVATATVLATLGHAIAVPAWLGPPPWGGARRGRVLVGLALLAVVECMVVTTLAIATAPTDGLDAWVAFPLAPVVLAGVAVGAALALALAQPVVDAVRHATRTRGPGRAGRVLVGLGALAGVAAVLLAPAATRDPGALPLGSLLAPLLTLVGLRSAAPEVPDAVVWSARVSAVVALVGLEAGWRLGRRAGRYPPSPTPPTPPPTPPTTPPPTATPGPTCWVCDGRGPAVQARCCGGAGT